LFFFQFHFSSPAHVKQNADTNTNVGAACQSGLAVDFIVGLAATRLTPWDAGEPIAPILLEGFKPSCVPDLEQRSASAKSCHSGELYLYIFRHFYSWTSIM